MNKTNGTPQNGRHKHINRTSHTTFRRTVILHCIHYTDEYRTTNESSKRTQNTIKKNTQYTIMNLAY